MKLRTRLVLVSANLVLLCSAAFGATVELQGLLNPNDTALVSNPFLSGSTYSFTIQNTAAVGIIATLALVSATPYV